MVMTVLALLQWNYGFLCLMFHIYVPSVCKKEIIIYVDMNLLNMEMILHTQILKKFHTEGILVQHEVGNFFSLKRKKVKFFKLNFFFSMSYKKIIRATNTHQIVMRPEYDVNELYAPLWFTSDNFLKIIWWPDENFMKFHEKIIRHSKKFQKVIRNEPETL